MNKITPKIDAFFERLNQFIATVVAVSIGLFTVLVCVDFALRYFRLGGVEWLNEGSEYFLFFGVFLSAAWVLRQGAHVRVDIVISLLPHKVAIWLERLMDIFGSLLCGVMAYLGATGTISAFVLGTLPDKDIRIPNWIVLSIFSASFVSLMIEFLLRYHRASGLHQKEECL